MDILVISSENNILHICNQGYSANYTLYDCKGHSKDGGVLESSKEELKNDLVIEEIVTILKYDFPFTSPYIYLTGEKVEPLLELIEEEDYKHTQGKVTEFLSSIQEKTDIMNNEMELEQ